MKTGFWTLASVVIILLSLGGCRQDDIVIPSETVPVDRPTFTRIEGFYMLNQGNMGSNKSTLDYYDYRTGEYMRNIYGTANPSVPKELGDVGNDLRIYGGCLYAVINCSNKIEVMDAATCRRIGQVDIPNCRYIAFSGRYAYVTSYAGPVEIDPDYKQLGYVARIDTATLEIVDRCLVGFQPDGLAVVNGKIYVANSGGYRAPDYETKLSVIDAATMTVESEIEVAPNLQYVVVDSQRRLWVSSRGDYRAIPGRLYCYDIEAHRIVKDIDVNVTSIWVDGDSIYTIGSAWNDNTQTYANTYGIIDTRRMEQMSDCFITDGTEQKMMHPAGVAVNPLTKEIFVTDARNYVNPGYLYCFTPEGTMKWRVRTGDIPSCIAFRGI